MKRILSLVVVLLMLLCAVSCDVAENDYETSDSQLEILNNESRTTEAKVDESVESEADAIFNEFVEFLDGEGFYVGMTQGAYLDLISSYLTDSGLNDDNWIYFYYDSENGGGIQGDGNLGDLTFSFKNDFYQNDEITRYTNSLETQVEFEGLDLPFGIELGDDIEIAFEKLGIADPDYSFVADSDDKTKMTLFDNGNEKLIYYNLGYTDAPVDYYEPYRIVFVEKYEKILDDGRVRTEMRTVELFFSDFGGKLTTVSIKTSYEY